MKDSLKKRENWKQGQPEDRRWAEEAGLDAHIVKPVDPEKLGELLALSQKAFRHRSR